jgi:hypothetical protein
MTHSATDKDDPTLMGGGDFFFTILALLSLLASVAMAMDNNWSGAVFGFVAAIVLLVMAIV